ncbi:uncharacterized protein LOC122951389 [Acropora millepora]|uniref:uncharacterized protein LOC122951389 n=1 Tax=Acropora millepora TaxID=45264 RepID=UPI001CF0F740|nr:uncharacterized protein LOC122951389 [Acropora millepora]
MPTSCCVPQCTRKGYLDENGSKVSHFTFPDDQVLRKKWIHAIRRDVGIHFQLKKWTKVCSRHFREYDFIKTLSETQTNEEPVERENASESEEDETNEIESSTKQDVATQTNEIRSNDSADSDKEMNSQLIDLKTELERANRRIESLQQQMFTVDRFRGDDSSIKFYTGFPNWDTFNAVFKYLNPGNEGQNISYWVSKINVNVSAAVYEGENE